MDEAMIEAVKALLKESLSISIDVDKSWDFSSSDSMRAEVTLMLDGDVISRESCSFSISCD